MSHPTIPAPYPPHPRHTRIGALMRTASSTSLIYTIAVIVCAIIVWVIILAIPVLLFGMGSMM
jgi:hypothetical protein